MRHLKAGRALGVSSSHRRAMLRNMVTSLLEHEQIKTTVARAKELRKPLDKMITLGKRGDLHARRQALTFVKSKESMARLFGTYAERYADREGGFSRILKLGPRRGDGAEMALVMLVGSPNDPFMEEQPQQRRKRGGAKPQDVIDEVAATVRSDEAPAAAAKSKADSRDEAPPDGAAGQASAQVQAADAGSEAAASADGKPSGEEKSG